MPPRKPPAATETYAVVLGDQPYEVDAQTPGEPVEAVMLDLAEETHLAVIRERVRNGTSDFQDARWLLGILDKVLGS